MSSFCRSGLNSVSGYMNSTLRPGVTANSSGGVAPEITAAESERRRRRNKKSGGSRPSAGGSGDTPDWIRNVFVICRRGQLEKLVSRSLSFINWMYKHDHTYSYLCMFCVYLSSIYLSINLSIYLSHRQGFLSVLATTTAVLSAC